MTDKILNALKGAAWERAKGELHSIAAMSHAPETATSDQWAEWDRRCDLRSEKIAKFIREMEDEELYLN